MSHRHRFRRLSDVAIYCECGEIRESPVKPGVAYPLIGVQPFPQPPFIPVTPPVIPPTPGSPYSPPPWRYPNTTAPDITVGGTTTFDMTGITVIS